MDDTCLEVEVLFGKSEGLPLTEPQPDTQVYSEPVALLDTCPNGVDNLTDPAGVEGTVLDAGNSLAPAPLSLAVQGRALALAGLFVGPRRVRIPPVPRVAAWRAFSLAVGM
ncbi:hypothetical protein [Streptomyces sp. NPDC057403]|uniref:hypothetical protein n=1 Tax=Streptomyces sp. NPDC057403 TaxID=3346119 RepID=UPI00369165C9